jgi:hypothetical protein
MTMPADAPAWLRDVLTDLARAQAQAAGQITTLAAAQGRTEERLDRLTAAQAETATQLAQLVGVVQQMNDRLARVEVALGAHGGRLRGVENRLGDLSGRVWEDGARDRIPNWLGDVAGAVQVLTPAALSSTLDRAVNAGTLTRPEATAIRRADLVCSGTDPASGAPVYLVVEVSARVDLHDVARATTRAGLLARVGTPTIPVVVGQRLDRDAEEAAEAASVRTLIDPDA